MRPEFTLKKPNALSFMKDDASHTHTDAVALNVEESLVPPQRQCKRKQNIDR